MDEQDKAPSKREDPGLTIAPSMDLLLGSQHGPEAVNRRILWIALWAIILGALSTAIAAALVGLINLFTHLAFYQEWGWDEVSPTHHALGPWVIALPILGGLIIGLMARFGSSAIRGHGIPEAMERILKHQSVIPLRMTFLKPLSAAISIGTGGPFGAEGPIIATGGALGSFFGQIMPFSSHERKTLLAAGAAGGMTAIFGSPVAAVLLAIELLLFEYRPRSFLPVALSAATAAALRIASGHDAPAFPMPDLATPSAISILSSLLLGLVMGFLSMLVTRSVYAVEDAFEKLPLHWMWWPALGGLAVGVIGWMDPRTLGVGYSNITDILGAQGGLTLVASLVVLKFVSWSLALGSGTSGGTLAPLFTIGAGCGYLIAKILGIYAPWLDLDPALGALVGMAAIFAGASRALLASVIFAFETTRQSPGLLPLLAGCTSAYLFSSLFMRHSIMTLRMERRGVKVPSEYSPDPLDQLTAEQLMARNALYKAKDLSIAAFLARLSAIKPSERKDFYVITDENNQILGIMETQTATYHEPSVTSLPIRPAPLIRENASLRQALQVMRHIPDEDLKVLIVINTRKEVLGFVSLKDLLAHPGQLDLPKRIRSLGFRKF